MHKIMLLPRAGLSLICYHHVILMLFILSSYHRVIASSRDQLLLYHNLMCVLLCILSWLLYCPQQEKIQFANRVNSERVNTETRPVMRISVVIRCSCYFKQLELHLMHKIMLLPRAGLSLICYHHVILMLFILSSYHRVIASSRDQLLLYHNLMCVLLCILSWLLYCPQQEKIQFANRVNSERGNTETRPVMRISVVIRCSCYYWVPCLCQSSFIVVKTMRGPATTINFFQGSIGSQW